MKNSLSIRAPDWEPFRPKDEAMLSARPSLVVAQTLWSLDVNELRLQSFEEISGGGGWPRETET